MNHFDTFNEYTTPTPRFKTIECEREFIMNGFSYYTCFEVELKLWPDDYYHHDSVECVRLMNAYNPGCQLVRDALIASELRAAATAWAVDNVVDLAEEAENHKP